MAQTCIGCSSESLQDATTLTDAGWVSLHVPRFSAVRPRYETYAQFLNAVLTVFCKKVAPMAIVQTRTKTVPSFAEKILRKRSAYTSPAVALPPDPLLRLTDLCGGRVIAQTSEQVKAVCALIEQCFDIDWENSDDASMRLKTTEFGYRTINYIVMLNPGKLAAAHIDIPIPDQLVDASCSEGAATCRFKAEIQVRTLLEHAYADIAHDLTYKTEVKVPDRIQRSFSALAAILETTDRQFARLIDNLQEFRSNYGAYHTRAQVESEISRLRIVLEHDQKNPTLAIRIARLALGIGDCDQAIDVLAGYRASGRSDVVQTLGAALTARHWDSPGGSDFRDGCVLLETACASADATAERLCTLAECLVHAGRGDDADACYQKALILDAAEPRSLCGYLAKETGSSRNNATLRLAVPMIRNALSRCALQIEGRVNLPDAWGCKAFLHLLVGEPFQSLDAFAHLLDLYERPSCQRPKRACVVVRAIARLSAQLQQCHSAKQVIEGLDWLERAVLLGMASRIGDTDALRRVRELASPAGGIPVFQPDDRIVILAGGCADAITPFIPEFKDALVQAVKDQSFTLMSGGTPSGVSGVADALAAQSDGKICALGYLPKSVMETLQAVGQTGHYHRLFPSSGSVFTPLDPLQGWTDLIAAGVDPSRVKVMGYACGAIARFEYAWALALGARVGVVDHPQLPKERRFDDPAWFNHPGLLPLPLDPMTLHAFLRIDSIELRAEDRLRLEPAARMAHEEYVKSVTPKDPSLKPWNELNEPLKRSNYHQVAFWEQVLNDLGLRIRALTDEDAQHEPLDLARILDPETIQRLAQMEHGRWNVERLSLNWRYAKEKDVVNRRSPYLISWQHLTPEIQKYDINAVLGLSRKLRSVGLELEMV